MATENAESVGVSKQFEAEVLNKEDVIEVPTRVGKASQDMKQDNNADLKLVTQSTNADLQSEHLVRIDATKVSEQAHHWFFTRQLHTLSYVLLS